MNPLKTSITAPASLQNDRRLSSRQTGDKTGKDSRKNRLRIFPTAWECRSQTLGIPFPTAGTAVPKRSGMSGLQLNVLAVCGPKKTKRPATMKGILHRGGTSLRLWPERMSVTVCAVRFEGVGNTFSKFPEELFPAFSYLAGYLAHRPGFTLHDLPHTV